MSQNIKNKKDPDRKNIKKASSCLKCNLEKSLTSLNLLFYNVHEPDVKEKQWNNMANNYASNKVICSNYLTNAFTNHDTSHNVTI